MRPEAGDDIDDLRRLVTQAYRASDGGEQVAGTGDPVKERRRSRSSIVRQWVAVVRRLIGCLPSSPVYERDASPSQQAPIALGILPPPDSRRARRTLILDLDETLIHSSFVPIPKYDLLVPITMAHRSRLVYVQKRPHVDEFLRRVHDLFEVVVFTASLSLYADPVLDVLDPANTSSYRLYREHCVQVDGQYIKDLSVLGRDLHRTIIVDNSPHSYSRQPYNAVPVASWFGDDDQDRSLIDTVLPRLEDIAMHPGSVYDVLHGKKPPPRLAMATSARTAAATGQGEPAGDAL
ncbi:FCP1 homology domain-containing protein [Plasmodiophora brassicae]